jgi:hypothetical protein
MRSERSLNIRQEKIMGDRTAVLKKCIKETLAQELAQNSFSYDGKYTFRHIDHARQTVRLIEFQPGIKSASGQFTVNVAIFSPLYCIGSPAPTLEEASSGYCLFRDRLGCIRRPNQFWTVIFGVPNKWWQKILYGPRDIWWTYSENRQITEASVNECRKLINDVGLSWLEMKDDVEALKNAYNTMKARRKK